MFSRRRLSAYVDGELGPDERRRVARHVEECEDCGRAERSLRRLIGGLRLLGGGRPPTLADDAIERVRAADGPAERARSA